MPHPHDHLYKKSLSHLKLSRETLEFILLYGMGMRTIGDLADFYQRGSDATASGRNGEFVYDVE